MYPEKVALFEYIGEDLVVHNAMKRHGDQDLRISSPFINNCILFFGSCLDSPSSPTIQVVHKKFSLVDWATAETNEVTIAILTNKANLRILIISELQVTTTVTISIFNCLPAAGNSLKTGDQPRKDMAQLHYGLNHCP